jgi:hypothetical protein
VTRVFYTARFFFVVPPMPLLMIGAFAVVVVVAGVMVAIDSTRAAGTLTPILLLQTFACSSGFDVPARRGHYDLLLTSGGTRAGIATAHWMASSLPGALAWAALALVHELTAGNHGGTPLLDSGTVVALLLVSTIPWATTVRLPRFSGAIGWLLVVAILTPATPSIFNGALRPNTEYWGWIQSAFAVLVYPPLLVGRELTGDDRLLVAPALLSAVAAVLIGIWSVGRRDIPLEAAQ